MAVTVTCVCVPPAYSETHVTRLFNLAREHLCGFVFQPLWESPWPGWWSKISLFEPGRFNGRTLYLDLDTTPCGPLADLAEMEYDFIAARDWLTLGINSSVMAWTPSERTERIYTEFVADPDGIMSRHHGDQTYIHAMMPDAQVFPRRWVRSYKADKPHADQRVTVFHGEPKPWDVE